MTERIVSARTQWLVFISIDLGVALSTSWQYYTGRARLVVALYIALGVLLAANLFVAFKFWGRKRGNENKPSKSLLIGVPIMAILSWLVTFQSVALIHPRNDILDLANSGVALEQIEPATTRLVVELVRKTAANSREENIELEKARKSPIDPPLYSPASFASKEAMVATWEKLRQYSDVDLDYFQKQQAVTAEFRSKMSQIDSEYLASWDRERKNQEALERATNDLEIAFLESVNTLYTYALRHADDIHVKDNKILIKDADVNKAFNDHLKQSKDLNLKLQSNVQQQSRRQQELRSHISGS